MIDLSNHNQISVKTCTSFYSRHGKRAFDLAFALALLPFLLPVIVLLAIATRLDGGPAIFGHQRVGLGGHEFNCLKIRTMRVGAEEYLQKYLAENPDAAEEWQQNYKLRDDPRITKIGKFLRKTSLDELPQIFNVIRGDMSFVGPRPVTETELEVYGPARVAYAEGRPGITGKWQVSGRNEISYEERILLDVTYRETETLLGDLKIIAKTPLKVIRPTGF